MSSLWTGASAAAAARICAFSREYEMPSFTPWSAMSASPAPEESPCDDLSQAIDPAELEADAFAHGFDEGRRTAEIEIAEERAAVGRLAATLEALRPQPPQALGELLAETVERLVRQIVGEVTIDGALLMNRAQAAAALIAGEATPSKMRLNPQDRLRLADAGLPVELVADAALAPGSIVLETGEGWIEDGSEIALDRLRTALDRMGVPR